MRKILMVIAAVITAVPFLFAQSLRYEPPLISGYEPPFQSNHNSPLTGNNPSILKNSGKMFTDTTIIDFEKRQITFSRRDSEGNSVWTYHYGELNEYINDSRAHSFYEEWYNKLTDEAKYQLKVQPPTPKLEWELAVHYPPWAQRLLGNEPPRLKIEGRLQLTAAFERTETVIDKNSTVDLNPLDITPEYDFAIRGRVGRLISVNITHSKQDGFDLGEDPLKNFKVEYKESEPGELEDEIIQEIVVGATGFDMPGTNLSGYSEKHDGLFGIKARAKIGPLMLTAVASQAQGEALTRELGGKNDPYGTSAVRENEFIKNRYFFLDNVYKDYHNQLNNITQPDRNAARPPRVTAFQAFVSIRCEETSQSTIRRYKADINGSEVCFKMLIENEDYTADRDRGWVRFEYNVKDDEIVAITMTAGSMQKGVNVPNNAANNSTQILWQLKPNNMEQLDNSEPLFGLMWRNVYYLSEVEDSKIDLYFKEPSSPDDTVRNTSQSTLLSRALGITDDQGRARVENVEIFNLEKQELIFPPWGPSRNGNEPFANPALGPMADTAIYRLGSRTTYMSRDYVPKFGIVTGGSTRRTSYDNLGWNIMPGTVTVKTNTGSQLVEGEDYELDYDMGIIDLISTKARAAESIIISYQRESDFVLDRKIFVGLRGEMKLPFISDNSFMAASILYQDATTSADDIPQRGNEPFSKLHLSFNTSLNFEPEWMTKAVNYIPFVKSDESSSAKFDFEIVQSRMNTNTSKSRGAYIDDFERAKDGYSLSLRHPSWQLSHYPFDYLGRNEILDGDERIRRIDEAMRSSGRIPAWNFYWFTPNANDTRNLISRFSVWTKDPNNARYGVSDTYIDVLRLHATPAPASADVSTDVVSRFKNAYASITTSFGRTGLNMENHRYLEIVVNPKGTELVGYSGKKGKLKIQIGRFSHDQVQDGGPPNGRFDLEDTTYQNRAELLSQFDKGLNRRDVADKFYVIPTSDKQGWDTLSRTRNTNLLVSPRDFNNPSGDLYRKYDRDNVNNFRFANGTWGNSIYDSENIDYDGIPRINIIEDYYTFEIDLDNANSPYIDTTSRVVGSNGWRFYRIPLKDILNGISITKDSSGAPNWSKMRGMRLVWYDFEDRMLTTENELHIAGLEFVGNFWEPQAGAGDKIEPMSINNVEDLDYYYSVYGTIAKHKSGEATPIEGSLRLRLFNLFNGDTAMVRKNISYDPQNISGYDSVSIMVNNRTAITGDDFKFIFRFGSDDSTYYEYSAPMNRNMAWEKFEFGLQAMSDLKLAAGELDNQPINVMSGRLRVVAPSGKRPNFTAITYMAVGVTRGVNGPIEGEIWVNELVATGARKLTGVAARINLSTQWSDFLSLNVGAGYTDGDFRTMTDATIGNENKSELFTNVSAKVRLDKFLPDEWGVSIPVGGSISGALSRPTVKPRGDELLLNDNGKPDGLMDMVDDMFNMMSGKEATGSKTRAQRFETFSTTRNIYTSFEKTSESENPFVNFLIDRVKTDVSYNMTASHTVKGQHPDPDSADYLKTDTSLTYAGNLRYDLSPRNPPEWTSATPFRWIDWMPSYYKSYKFNLLPSTLEFDLAEVQYKTETRNDPKLNVYDFTARTFDMRHGVRVDYTPIDPLLNLSYSARFDRDMSDLIIDDWDSMIDGAFPNIFGLNNTDGERWDKYGMLYGEKTRTQSASAKLTPQFVKFMTHSAEYTANYVGQSTRRDNDSAQYLNAGVNTALRFKNTLLLTDFFKGLAGNKTKSATAQKDSTDKKTAPVKTDSSSNKNVVREKTFWERLSGGVDKINMRSINFEYDVSTDLKNSFLSSTYLADTLGMSNYDFFRYQLGMSRDYNEYLFGELNPNGLGGMFYREGTGVSHELYRFDQSMGSWTARLSTTFTIPDPIKITFTSVSFGWGREFYAQPDTAYIDTTVVYPEIRASANTDILTKLSFVRRHLSKLSLNSTAGYKSGRKESKDRTDTTSVFEFQPLISLDGKFHKWPSLSANYRYGRSVTNTVSGGKGEEAGTLSSENNAKSSHAVTLGYEFTNTGRIQEIKLGKWVFPIQGKTKVGVTVNHEKNVTRTHKIGDEDEEVREDSDLNYSPFLDYKFTDNISGEARYLGTHKNQDGRKINQQRFSLSVLVVF